MDSISEMVLYKEMLLEGNDPIAAKAAKMIGPRGVDKRDLGVEELELLHRVASGNYSGADRAKASQLITTFYKPDPKLPESATDRSIAIDEAIQVVIENLKGLKEGRIAGKDLARSLVEGLEKLK